MSQSTEVVPTISGAGEGLPVHRHRGHDEWWFIVEGGWTITTSVPGGIDLFFEDMDTAASRGTVPQFSKVVRRESSSKPRLAVPRTSVSASAGDRHIR
jgi:hypothetical protein